MFKFLLMQLKIIQFFVVTLQVEKFAVLCNFVSLIKKNNSYLLL